MWAGEMNFLRSTLFGSILIAALVAVSVIATGTSSFAQSDSAQSEAESEVGPELPAEVLNSEIDSEELDHRLVPLTKDELAALAAEWLSIVKSKTEEVMATQIAIANTEGDTEEAARTKLTELVQERKALFEKYSKVVNAWEKKNGDETAVAEYRAYRNAIIVEETRTADFETLVAKALSWMMASDGGIQLAIDIGIIVSSFIGLLIVARIIRRIARRWIGHVPNLSKLLQVFLVAVIYWLVMAFGLMVVLSALGVDISPVFALIGGASFIMAFAFQDTLGNLASGLMIMINRPFDEGDYVDVGGVAGTVKSVSIVATTVVTPDNQIIVIPNKNVWGNVITNVTTSPTRRVDLMFGIGYDDSIELTHEVLNETVEKHPLVLKDPAPVIRVHQLGASSVDFIVRPWVKGDDYWTVYWDLTRQVKEAFDAAGISIPYPQQDIHVRNQESSPPLESSAASTKKPVSQREGEPGHEDAEEVS